MGITGALDEAGVIVLEGVCFYQMYAKETARANRWKTLVSNSAKLVNIIQGYDYVPVLATTEQCVDAAVAGKI
jgi:predicted aconitase